MGGMPLDIFLPDESERLPFDISPDGSKELVSTRDGVIFRIVNGIGKGRVIYRGKAKKIEFASNDVAVIHSDKDALLVLDTVTLSNAIPKPPVKLVNVDDFAAGGGRIGVTFMNGISVSMTERGAHDVEYSRPVLWSNHAEPIGFETDEGIDVTPTKSDNTVSIDVYGNEIACSSIDDDGVISITALVGFENNRKVIKTTIAPGGEVSRVVLASIDDGMQQPHVAVDRRSAEALFVSGFVDHEPKAILLAKNRAAAAAMVPRAISSRNQRVDINLPNGGSALLTSESLMSPPRRFVFLSKKGNIDEHCVDSNVDIFSEPSIDYEGTVNLVDNQSANVIIYKFDSLPAVQRTTVVLIGDDDVQAGRYNPTVSWLLTHGYAVMFVDLPHRYVGPVNSIASSSEAQDGGHDLNDVILSMKKSGVIKRTVIIGEGITGDAALITSSIRGNAVDGVIAVRPLMKSFDINMKPTGCNALIVSRGSSNSREISYAERANAKSHNPLSRIRQGSVSVMSDAVDKPLDMIERFIDQFKI